MCLYTQENKMRTATEDMVCYKVLQCYPNDVYRSPFFPFKGCYGWDVKSGKVVRDKNKIVKIRESCLDRRNRISFNCITQGGFHVFKNQVSAKMLMSNLKLETEWYKQRYYKDAPNYVVATCIIPKGTKYYYGRSSNNTEMSHREALERGEETYVAKKLIIKEVTFLDDQDEQ